MASRQTIRLGAAATEETETSYACGCGNEYMNKDSLEKHQQTNCKNRSIQCSFCQETVQSTVALHDHLLLCGNKTDECPNCRQFIRRSHFAYHYENNCASVDDIETPPTRHRNQPVHRTPINPNKPYSREDIISHDYQENYNGQQTLVYPQRINGRIQTPISNIRNSPVLIECEYCHSRCAQNDYHTHRDNCLGNPTNMNNRQPPARIPLGSNQNQGRSPVNGHSSPNGVVHIPCEYCNELVDLPNWSNHTQSCRERETRRLANRAKSISEEPVNEQIPCEYCQQLFTADRLHAHENNCLRNPDHMAYAANLARPRPSKRVVLPKLAKNNRNHSPSSNAQGFQNPRVVYQSIDIDRTHAANRSSDNDISINPTNAYRHPMQRTASDEIPLESGNSLRGAHGYDNVPARSKEHRSNENMQLVNKQVGRRLIPPIPGSPNGTSQQRLRSSYDDLEDISTSQNPSRAVANRSPYYNDSKHQDRLHSNHDNPIVIDNQPGQHINNRQKKQSKLSKFFCGARDDGSAIS